MAGESPLSCWVRSTPQCDGATIRKQTVGVLTMNGRSMLIVATMALVLAILSGVAISAQDKYTLRVPDGLAFSAFKGYEDWQLISSAKTDDRMKVILGNPTIIAAYKSGIPD